MSITTRMSAPAASHRPSFFARSTSASPAGFIVPASMSATALSRLIFDQMLFGPRGVNRWSHAASSSLPFCPSTHPHVSATSSASA
jgi:hypothetical protein